MCYNITDGRMIRLQTSNFLYKFPLFYLINEEIQNAMGKIKKNLMNEEIHSKCK